MGRYAARLLAVVLIVGAMAAWAGEAPPAPRRIVSLNVCADPLVLATADPDRIVALSPYARDPLFAQQVVRARAFPFTRGSAEEVLALKPDLVFDSGPRRSVVRDLLALRGVRIVDLPQQDSLAGVEAAMTTVAEAVGRPDRGRAEIARLEARLAALGPAPGRGRVAASYQRRGYLTGTGTLMDEMFGRVGLVNLATRLHRPILSQVSIEEIALAKPDFLVLETDAARVVDQGTAMLQHPVLERAVPPARRIYVPQALTVCGGPAYADAVEALAQGVRAADGVSQAARPHQNRSLAPP